MMQAAAEELKAAGAVPFAAYCTDPCDGRTQGTTGMFDSLPYRNDAATVFDTKAVREDVAAARDWLNEQSFVQHGKIATWGFGYGGTSAFLARAVDTLYGSAHIEAFELCIAIASAISEIGLDCGVGVGWARARAGCRRGGSC